MANMTDLLGALLQGGMTNSSSGRIQHSLGDKGIGGAGGILGDIMGALSQGTGASQYSVGSGSGGPLGSLGQLAGSMFGQEQRGNPMAAGGLGALAGALLGGGKGSVKGGLGGGALALLGSLALQAYRNSSGARTPDQGIDSAARLSAGLRPPENPEEEAELNNIADLTIKAMVNAAKVDGRIDEAEMQKIMGEATEDGITAEEKAYLLSEVRKPMDTAGLVRRVPNKQVAAQVYAATLFAIEADTPSEREYLRDLAAALDLEPAVVRQLHSALGVA